MDVRASSGVSATGKCRGGGRLRATAVVAMLLGATLTPLTGGTAAQGAAPAGTLWAWGTNDDRQLLDPLVRDRYTPLPVMERVTDFSVGYSTGAAVIDSEVWTWGEPPTYDGTAPTHKDASTPRRLPGLTDVEAVAVGDHHMLALDTAGKVWVWGDNDNGQLGTGASGGTVDEPTSLTDTSPSLPRFVDVEAGSTSSFAVDESGNVWAWGTRFPYSPAPVLEPTQVAGASDVDSVRVGGNHVLARTRAGQLLAWGSNYYGELGQGDASPRAGVVQVPGLSDVVAVGAGHDDSYAVLADGSLKSWGAGVTVPATVPGLPGVASVAATQYHRLVVGLDGTAHSWGQLAAAHLGRRGPAGEPAPVDADLPALVDADAGFFSSFLLAQDGTLYSFGTADRGALGDSYGRTLSPVRITPPDGTTQISAGKHHVLTLSASGEIQGWGFNWSGQLGSGPNELVSEPRAITVPATVSRVVAGYTSSYALDDTGEVWAWGSNSYGQLGDGTRQSRPTPQLIDLPTPIVDLDAGAQSGIALDTSGQVWAWGGNSSGEVGTGDGDERLTPFAVPLTEAVTDVVMGEEHAAALDATGTVWAWGWNNRGQVGGTPNQPNQQQSPREVPGLPADIVSLVAGDAQTLALDADGSVWEWGRVLPGGAGTGTPIEVTGIPPMSQVSANGNVRIGRSTTGEVWVWGDNVEGDLATGDTSPVSGPHRLGLSGATWVEVSKNYRNNAMFVLASPALTTTAAVAAGGTLSSRAGVGFADPVSLAVTSPVAGTVSISEDPTAAVPGGLTVFGAPFVVEAPAASAADPLVLTFRLHHSAVPAGTPLSAITPLRDGVLVADCAAGSGASAVPDPCVSSRTRDPLGSVELVVRTSHASVWALVEHTGPPPRPPLVSVDGISDGDVLLLNDEAPVTVTCEERGIAVTACEGPTRADTATVGPHVLVASATDSTGAVTSVEVGYEVRFAFSGFDGAAAAPTVNVGKAGRTYPLSWSLRDAAGVRQSQPSAVAAVKVRPVSCGQFDLATGDPLDATTAGSSGLRVQPDGSFAYNWKAPRTAGCHRLEVHLADGTAPWLAFSMR